MSTWKMHEDEFAVDAGVAARGMAAFVAALQAVDPLDGPRSSRGGRAAMASLDAAVRMSAEAARGMIDTAAFLAAWDEAGQAPGWSGQAVWVHSDLLAPNV